MNRAIEATGPVTWLTVPCKSRYACTEKLVSVVSDRLVKATNRAVADGVYFSAGVLARAMATHGWRWIGDKAHCPDCFQRVYAEASPMMGQPMDLVAATDSIRALRSIEFRDLTGGGS